MNAEIADSTARREEKAAEKAAKLQAKAEAEGEMKDTIATRDADIKYLADVTATCEQKASDFASRQQLRADEIAALEEAKGILEGEAVSGNAAKHLPAALLQQPALVQLRADGRSPGQ